MFQAIITVAAGPAATSLLPTGVKDVNVQGLILQARGTNSGPLYIGRTGVTTTSYLFRINAPTGGVPLPPMEILMPDRDLGTLGSYYVIGTAGEILHVAYIPR